VPPGVLFGAALVLVVAIWVLREWLRPVRLQIGDGVVNRDVMKRNGVVHICHVWQVVLVSPDNRWALCEKLIPDQAFTEPKTWIPVRQLHLLSRAEPPPPPLSLGGSDGRDAV
jgi:hypothetical protein